MVTSSVVMASMVASRAVSMSLLVVETFFGLCVMVCRLMSSAVRLIAARSVAVFMFGSVGVVFFV